MEGKRGAASRAMETDTTTDPATDDAADGPMSSAAFTTDAIPRAEQFEAWRQRWDPIIEMRHPGDAAAGYLASNEVWDLGGIALSRVAAPPLLARRHAAQVRRDQIDSWLVACARRGTIRHAAAGRETVIEAGVPVLHSMAEPFESSRTAIRWVALFFARDLAPELNAALEAARNRPLDTGLGGLLGDFLLSLDSRIERLGEAERCRLAQVIRPMLAACIAPSADRLAEAEPIIDQTRRARARQAVRRHLGAAGLTPGRLARIVGISRSNLYRLFEPEGGVARYIMAQRMRAAHDLLSDPANRAPIRAIAEAVGFADASAFSRGFRRTFGCSPGELREAAPAARGRPGRVPAVPDLPALLRRL